MSQAGHQVPAEPDREAAMGRHDKLDMRLWLRMLTCTTMIERRIRARMRAEFGTTLPRYDALAQLYRWPDGLSMGDLSNLLMVSNGNATVLVDRLVQDGLATREPAGHDRRSLWVRLTPKGHALFERMTEQLNHWVEGFFADAGRDEKMRLLQQLGRLKQAVKSSAAFSEEPGD